MLVSTYIVERGLILEPFEVNAKTNEIKAIPAWLQKLALKGVVFAFDAINTKKTCELIISSGNDYIAALKGNQPGLSKDVNTKFIPEFSYEEINKGHGRIEQRRSSICQTVDGIRIWSGLKTLIRVESERQIIRQNHIEVENETRYYISSLSAKAREFGERIRG